MRLFYIFLFLTFITSVCAQDLHHQMLSSQGASKQLSNGMYVSQTIGQQSVIGTYTKNGITYQQGFQQFTWSKYISNNTTNAITTIIYPNPFIQTINFQFSQSIKDAINVEVYDINGRLIFRQEKKPVENILTIDLPQLASVNYLVRLTAPNYIYYSQIIRQQ